MNLLCLFSIFIFMPVIDSNSIYNELLSKVNYYSGNDIKNISLKYLYQKFNLSNSDLLLNKTINWNKKINIAFNKDIEKINNGIPIQYIAKSQFFYDQNFYVDESVLIPRPETEELVSHVIRLEKGDKKKNVLDIGTGSGCIAISLFKHLEANVFGIDSSKAAIKIANKNNKLIENQVRFIHLGIEEYNPEINFDIIVSNPPYISINDKKRVDENVLRHEPYEALFVDKDPLYFYRKILMFCKNYLNRKGNMYFEINDKYVNELGVLFSGYDYKFINDIYGKKRFLFVSVV
ncbi:MAG: protein-(glutamine-N5) methyltransferase, release factor-specific [Rhodothermaeota bacterium MED-G19]|nr:MAG: protein-(glutamine-N5) methyltransferase, release factor-specific [Rhodothermaeota bacterium MED-G19]